VDVYGAPLGFMVRDIFTLLPIATAKVFTIHIKNMKVDAEDILTPQLRVNAVFSLATATD